MSSCYRLYINGKLIHQRGVPGTSRESETPEWKPDIAFFAPHSAHLDIVVHVSNFHYAKGGMWGNILFGSKEGIVKYRDISLMRSFLLFGILSITALFMLSLSLIEKNFPCLYLGLFCLACALREITVREVAIWNILGHIHHSLLAKLEYITMPLITLFYIMFIYNLYKREFSKKVYTGISLIMVVLTLFTLLTEPNIFSSYLWVYKMDVLMAIIYSAFIIARAFIKKNPSSGIILAGIVIMLLAIVNDILYVEKINTNYGAAHAYTIAFSIFLMTQIYTVFFNIWDNYKRAGQAARSQLMLMQSQIKPHFLFNILNTIQAFIDENPRKSKRLINVLANYLRSNFKYNFNPDVSLIPLKEELELIQPLVENSIKHGLIKGKLRIVVSAKLSPDDLIINVKDDGVGMSRIQLYNLFENKTENRHDLAEGGIGLENVRMRMRVLYNRDIEIYSQKGRGTRVSLIIPSDNSRKLKGVAKY